MARLLGGFTPRALVYLLSFKSHPEASLSKARGGPRRSNLSDGKGGQHNGVGTMGVEEKKVKVSGSGNQQDNNKSKGNDQVNDNTFKTIVVPNASNLQQV